MTSSRLDSTSAHPATTSRCAARARHAHKVYGAGDTAVTALDDLTLDLPAGEFTAIMGPSGLRQVDADALPGRPGHAHHRARCSSATTDLASLSDRERTILRRDRLGFVFQSFNLLPTLTAEENITLPADLAGRTPDRGVVRHRGRQARPRRPAAPPALRALRRTAAAGRRGPGPDLAARRRLRRRAHRRARLARPAPSCCGSCARSSTTWARPW